MPKIRKIIHVDMDSFFVSVEERNNPSLKGKPVAVGGREEHRGVISTANYIARKYGVHSALSTAQAKRLCPNLILIPPNIDEYREISHRIRSIFKDYTPLVEPLSLDEAFLDVSDCMQCWGSATWIAEEIRRRIHETENLTASAGVSVNKFIAKVASNWKKPNGQFVVPPSDVETFVSHLDVEKIFGVGPKTAEKIHRLGAATCADLQQFSEEFLVHQFGKFGSLLYSLCRGMDNRPVNPNRIRKSLSVEETFSKDLASGEACHREMQPMVEKLKKRLIRIQGPSFRKVFIKIRFHDFTRTTVETGAYELEEDQIHELLKEGLQRGASKKVRLLGVGVRFEEKSSKQIRLFE